jgi:RNA polymerase-binding transcription factor DksA
MERRNSLSGLNTLGKAQNDLLQKTDKLTKLIEQMSHELEKASSVISRQEKEIASQREKNEMLEQTISDIINN